ASLTACATSCSTPRTGKTWRRSISSAATISASARSTRRARRSALSRIPASSRSRATRERCRRSRRLMAASIRSTCGPAASLRTISPEPWWDKRSEPSLLHSSRTCATATGCGFRIRVLTRRRSLRSSTRRWPTSSSVTPIPSTSRTTCLYFTTGTAGGVLPENPDAPQLVIGSAGPQTPTGGPQGDILVAGTGQQTMTGGDGADKFVFDQAGPTDATITDFLPSTDKIELDGLQRLHRGDLRVNEVNGNTVIHVGDDQITLAG